LGKAQEQIMEHVALNEIHSFLPPNVRLMEDGTVRRVKDDGTDELVEVSYNSNGRPFLEFRGKSEGKFSLWLMRAFYEGFRGPIPTGCEVCAIDGNRANLKPSNLTVRPKSAPPPPLCLVEKPTQNGNRRLA
jgi:hypothetical protein